MSAISIKHHSVDRRFVAIGAVVLFLLSALLLIVPQEDTVASVTPVESTEINWETAQTQTRYNEDGDPVMMFRLDLISNSLGNLTTNLFIVESFPAIDHYDQLPIHFHTDSGSFLPYGLNEPWAFRDNTATGYKIGNLIPGMSVTYEVICRDSSVDDDTRSEPADGEEYISFEFSLVAKTQYRYTTTLSFDTNGGEGSYSTLTETETLDTQSTKNVTFDLPAEPTKDGFRFDGWATSASGEPITEPGDKTLTRQIGSDTQLYAKWVENTYVVTFHLDDGEEYDSVSVPAGQYVTAPDDPEPDAGWVFGGWYTDETFQTLFDFSEPITADTDVYAYFVEELEFTTVPTAIGTVTPVSGYSGLYVFQLGEGTGSTSIHWDFGDGHSSENSNATHQYSPGKYTATLTVYNSYGENSTTFDIFVLGDDDGVSDVLIYVAAGLVAAVIAVFFAMRFL